MPHAPAQTVIKTGNTVDKIEDDICEVAAIWFEQSKGDVQREMNRLEMKKKIKTEYHLFLVRMVEVLH